MTYSHPATRQDEWVLEKLGNGRMFVEVGAYDGVTHSNTLLLEENDWTGYLIEACPEFYEKCRANRETGFVQVLNFAIGDGDEKTLVVGGQYTGLIETMPDKWVAEHIRRGNKTQKVETFPLSQVVPYWSADYLSLDTEGGEYDILKQWFEDGGRPEAVTVEFRYDYDELKRLEYLTEQYEMHLDEVRGFDACFLRNDAC